MEGVLVLPRYGADAAGSVDYSSRIDSLEQDIGPEFDRELYNEQMRELEEYNRVLKSYHKRAIEYYDNEMKFPNDAVRLRKLRHELNSLNDMIMDYPAIGDWSDLEESRPFMRDDNPLFIAGKYAALLSIPVIGLLATGNKMSYAADNNGYVILQWCPSSGNPDYYRLYYIDEDTLNSDLTEYSLYEQDGGGPWNRTRWNYIDIPAGVDEFTIDCLDVGKIYHFRMTAINDSGESDLSKNEPIGVARIKGNIDISTTPSINRVDSYDIRKFREAMYSRPGDENWNPHCDLNNDGVVDSIDYNMLKAQYGIVQPNEMDDIYYDDSLIVEWGDYCEY